MFQTAIGRINSRIEAPSQSLDMKIFIDAGGQAEHQRVWGGLASIGSNEINWMKEILEKISKKNNIPISQELKGFKLPLEEIKSSGRMILENDRRILFWGNWILAWDEKKAEDLTRTLELALNSMKPNSYNLQKDSIAVWYKKQSSYFSKLRKPVNKYKILSIIVHLQWIINEVERCKLGKQLKSVEVIIDNENFPKVNKCGVLIKHFVAAGLQRAGMHYTLTGKALEEEANEGAIVVNAAGKSEDVVGIRFVDILLQAVLRKVMPNDNKM